MPWEGDGATMRASQSADAVGKTLKRIAESTGRQMHELVSDGRAQVPSATPARRTTTPAAL